MENWRLKLKSDLYVSPKYRGRKIASKLIQHINKLRKKLRKKYLRVDVRKKDLPARKLYKKLGFIILESKDESDSFRLIK